MLPLSCRGGWSFGGVGGASSSKLGFSVMIMVMMMMTPSTTLVTHLLSVSSEHGMNVFDAVGDGVGRDVRGASLAPHFL